MSAETTLFILLCGFIAFLIIIRIYKSLKNSLSQKIASINKIQKISIIISIISFTLFVITITFMPWSIEEPFSTRLYIEVGKILISYNYLGLFAVLSFMGSIATYHLFKDSK